MIKSILCVAITAIIIFLIQISPVAPAADATSSSEWVHVSPSGQLVYKTTPTGDKIMDFSFAGYMGGGVAFPNVPVVRSVKASGEGNDTAGIQAAINEVAQLPLKNGVRGAVMLEPGTFNCAQ